jgi:general secretion pathway protein J
LTRGFTLLEALISLGIMAMMGALIWGSAGPTFQLKDTVEAQADRDQEIRMAVNRMSRERLYENALESDQNTIQYKIVEDPKIVGQMNLVRREKVIFDDEPTKGGAEDVLCEDVQGLILRYWDPVKLEWAEDWNTLDVERANTLPFEVKISLLVGEPGTIPQSFTTTTPIFLPQPMDRTQ